jgi:predicted nucleic acid-binding protein
VSRSSLVTTIPAGDRLLLDTSVLAAYLDATDATHPVAVCVLKELVESGRNPAVVSMITVMEILVRPLRRSPPGHHTVLAFLRSHPNLAAVSVDLQIAQEAATLRATHRFAPPDALIVGTGIAAQVGHLVTNDSTWKTKLSVIADRIKVVRTADHLPFP